MAEGEAVKTAPAEIVEVVEEKKKPRKRAPSRRARAPPKTAPPKTARKKAVTREKEEKSSVSLPLTKNTFLLLIILIIAAAAGLAYYLGYLPGKLVPATVLPFTPSAMSNVVSVGDNVTVDYTGKFQNGTVFDTSYPDVAQQSGIYSPLRNYTPLSFVVGSGQLIPGFEDAVVGMKVGEEETVTLTPDRAYGMPKDELMQAIPRMQESPRVQNVSLDRFRTQIGIEPQVNLTFRLPNPGEFDVKWPMTVLAVSNDTVTFRYDPDPNSTVETVFGETKVLPSENSITLVLSATPGMGIVTLYGPAKVTYVNETDIVLDFNHPLAGKTLTFTIKVDSFTKNAGITSST